MILYVAWSCIDYIPSKAAASETDLTQEEELAVLKEQHALLSRLLHQQNEVSWTVL